MTEDRQELKPCECKDLEEVELLRDVNSYGACQVYCGNCGRSGPSSLEVDGSWKDCNAAEAIAAWNTRTPDITWHLSLLEEALNALANTNSYIRALPKDKYGRLQKSGIYSDNEALLARLNPTKEGQQS